MWIWLAVAIEGLALLGWLSVVLTRGLRVAFVIGFNAMAAATAIYAAYGDLGPRGVLVVVMVAVYLVRMNWTLLAWSGQTAVSKLDAATPSAGRLLLPVVLANSVGWGYCLPVYFATREPLGLGWERLLGAGIYVLGTVLHFGSDYQKRRFKLRPEARGKLLTSGFWAWCRHPNYLGDFLIYVSLAVVGGSVWGWISPLLNLGQYLFDAIPKNEAWAAARYGKDWDAYRSRTKALVPYVY
jgi:steroid 5-alpha reductase family enzyme